MAVALQQDALDGAKILRRAAAGFLAVGSDSGKVCGLILVVDMDKKRLPCRRADAPAESWSAKLNAPLLVTVAMLLPFSRISVPFRPVTVPPSV